MKVEYNQLTAMLAITKASLKAILRSPSTVIFSLAFPLIFILVFGFIGGGGKVSFSIAIDKNADTANLVFSALKNISGIKIVNKPDVELKEDLEKGRLTAIVNIEKNKAQNPPYIIHLKSSESVNPQNLQVLKSIISSIISNVDQKIYPNTPTFAAINENIQKIPGRTYRTIDFILPGQLGFSLLSAGVFGVAFLFFNLRQQLVLKRFYATPIQRSYIILGEGLSRVIFQLSTAVIIILIGRFAFHYTLVHGIETFLEIMVLSFISLILFMGFGFIVSGIAKTESTIPPLANIVTLPQFLLAGTFFSIDVFPSWLQPICKILPLTHFNDAMRKIAFEGAHLSDCLTQIGILALWAVVVYAVAIKVFKWE
ncbi:ABC transporter permease [Segetibacter sp.]|jgi:ABC-2 type transport system permease protein|uniref:ABC transporter permease n=1 Tax=Segetibacter sp. TaxID=2231182 RepID=UPI0026315214|nr:ABC transporter permease [Segetibacter sp.]MCW3079070.1 transporter permease [Segetibacter sp.]